MPYQEKNLVDFYLWHLVEIGLLDSGTRTSDLWNEICKQKPDPVTVAIIDTGVDTGHPNLQGAIDDGSQIDFTPHLYGAKYYSPLKSVKVYLEARNLDPKPSNSEMEELRIEVCSELRAWSKRLGLDIQELESSMTRTMSAGEKDEAFYKALIRVPGLSGYPPNGSNTPGPTVGEKMLPAAAPGMQTMNGVISSLGNGAIDEEIKAYWNDLQQADTIEIPVEDPSHFFGAHGTACAGLIGGRPEPNVPRVPPSSSPPAMDYYGVNPFCKILPISTPYSHEILPMVNALIYAVVHGAKVIHIPRGLPDYSAREAKMAKSHYQTRIDRPVGEVSCSAKPKYLDGLDDSIWNVAKLTEAEEEAIGGIQGKPEVSRDSTFPGKRQGLPQEYSDLPVDQADLFRLFLHSKMFERLLELISQEVVIVVSAGNDGWSKRLSYPARVHKDGGAADELVVVGAVNRRGYDPANRWQDYISSYSNGRDDYVNLGVLHALSDDGFALDQERIAFDERGRDSNDYSYEPHLPEGAENSYSDWGLLTLDVRSSYGYAAGRRYDPPEYDDGKDLGELYTMFGGTSGASALVAGVISLWLQLGLDPKTELTNMVNRKGGYLSLK